MRVDELIVLLETSSIDKRMEILNEHYNRVIEENKIPFIKDDKAIFIYRGEQGKVNLHVDVAYEVLDNTEMKRISGTDLFYIVKNYNTKTNMRYWFKINEEYHYDRLNEDIVNGLIVAKYASALNMPDYHHPELEYSDEIEHGKLIAKDLENTTVFGNKDDTRRVYVYLPANMKKDEKYKTIYFTDGTEYIEKAMIVNVLDYMIANGELEPVIGVFIDPLERAREYRSIDRSIFLDYIIDEIILMVERDYPAKSNRESRVIVGASNGGVLASYAAYARSDVFKYIFNQSGGPIYRGHEAFGEQDEFDLETAGVGFGEDFRTDNLPVKVFSVVGTFEGEGDRGIIERFHNDLKINPYIIGEKSVMYPQAHTWLMWGDSFREGILWLLYNKNLYDNIDINFESCSMKRFLLYLENQDVEKRQKIADKYFDSVLKRENYPIVSLDEVLLLYKGEGKELYVSGDFSFTSFLGMKMSNIDGTDVFYKSINLDNRTRLTYNFICDGNWKDDIYNDNLSDVIEALNDQVETKVGKIIEMPFYNYPERLENKEVEKGQLVEYSILNPVELEESHKERKLKVYLPYDYSQDKKYKMLYFISGNLYLEKADILNTLDSCIYNEDLKDVIAVFVDTINREKDCIIKTKKVFLNLIKDEIIPLVEREYNDYDDIERVIIGSSDAGGFALYAASTYPDIFQYVFNQSGVPMYKFDDVFGKEEDFDKSPFNEKADPFEKKSDSFIETEDEIYGEFYGERFKNRKLNLKILSVFGIYENQRNKDDGLKLHKDLEKNKDENRLVFYPQGHNFRMWGDSFKDGILWLLKNKETEIKEEKIDLEKSIF